MYINSVSGVQNTPSYMALYFTKTPTIMLDRTAEFLPHEDVTTTKRGIRYLKDKDVPKEIKKRFANNKYVKKMARKYDTFIWFVQSKGNDAYRSWAKVINVKNGDTELNNYYVIGKSNYDQITATDNMFTALKEQQFTVM